MKYFRYDHDSVTDESHVASTRLFVELVRCYNICKFLSRLVSLREQTYIAKLRRFIFKCA